MPFPTPAGPAVLVDNIKTANQCAKALGVHPNSIYNWAKNRKRTQFPNSLPFDDLVFDYAEVYEWFREWALEHPQLYPHAVVAILREEPVS